MYTNTHKKVHAKKVHTPTIQNVLYCIFLSARLAANEGMYRKELYWVS